MTNEEELKLTEKQLAYHQQILLDVAVKVENIRQGLREGTEKFLELELAVLNK